MKKIIIFLALIIVSCDDTNTSEDLINSNSSNETSTNQMNYLALGDSYTIGQSVPSNERFPNQLVDLLIKNGYQISQPKIIAQTGWTTRDLKDAIDKENFEGSFELVTLLIGVNNQYRNGSIETFRQEYIMVLNRALELAGYNSKNVIVLSIPDWGVSPFGKNRDRETIAKEINEFNKVKREETTKRNVKFIDITGISRRALNDINYIASDNLHFSGAMYRLWAEEIILRSF